LSNEIKLFADYVKPSAAEQAACEAVAQQVREFIKGILPDHSTEVFGSQRTGLALAISDIDIRLFETDVQVEVETRPNEAPRHKARKDLQICLRQLYERLLESKDYILVNRRQSRYPLISMQHKASGYDVQIVCNNDTSHARTTTKALLVEDPDLHALFAVFKAAFEIRGLTDVYRGGLGSYSLFIMIAAALQNSRHEYPNRSLVEKFMEVLRFWTKFNPYKQCLAVRTSDHRGLWPKLSLEESLEAAQKYRSAGDLVSLEHPCVSPLRDP
jgi:non-canonical poly(A) RNA polymerase PAPD5/7